MYCKYIPCVTIISGTPGAGYKAALRVQSERSERLRELTPAARRRGLYFIDQVRRRFVSRGFYSERGLQSFLTGAE